MIRPVILKELIFATFLMTTCLKVDTTPLSTLNRFPTRLFDFLLENRHVLKTLIKLIVKWIRLIYQMNLFYKCDEVSMFILTVYIW